MSNERSCSHCGMNHPTLSKDLLDLFEEVRQAVDPDEKAALMLQLADQFCSDIDITDESFDEGIHDMIDELAEARLVYQNSGLRLARMLVRSLGVAHALAPSPPPTEDVKRN